MEEVLVETLVIRRFAKLGGMDDIPDGATILSFCHLLEMHGRAKKIFKQVNMHLQRKSQGQRLGTIVDASSSTNSADGERDPEMHQVRKENQLLFGMKAHSGSTMYRGWCAAWNAQRQICWTCRRRTGFCTQERMWGPEMVATKASPSAMS
ncbi:MULTISPECIES: hypothetical protein [Stenotrophomonas]|uniref:hypothetical protein n=1 Tax=Stenotrophomonas TaxID=40323 RepID=UPI001CF436E8|nr:MULTISPECIES: hypothetical protein [Stenotrophomonas]MCA7024941.1 hypothetical protein [Stenotrophomonas acidaminiphila]MCE4074626.1 hypothetical protein [Stenotrophomonas acidaminiphila]